MKGKKPKKKHRNEDCSPNSIIQAAPPALANWSTTIMASNTPIPLSPSVNINGGIYINGRSYDVVKKLEVAEVYEYLKQQAAANANANASISRRQLAKAAGVGESTAAKIIREIESGGIVDPSHKQSGGRKLENAGVRSLSFDDELFLLQQRIKIRSQQSSNIKKFSGSNAELLYRPTHFLHGGRIGSRTPQRYESQT
jgi:hypothetical protein